MTQAYVNSSLDFLQVNVGGDYLQVAPTPATPPDYPTSPSPMEATVTSVTPTLVSVTNSLKRQTRSRGAHMWQIEFRYGVMTRATMAPLWAFLVDRDGRSGSFTVKVPSMTPQGTVAGTPRVNGASQTGRSIITDGWTAGSAIYKAGDWIQFDGDDKVYMVTADATADGSGNATISIFPSLRRSPNDNASVITDPYFTVTLASDITAVDISQCLHSIGFTVELLESLS